MCVVAVHEGGRARHSKAPVSTHRVQSVHKRSQCHCLAAGVVIGSHSAADNAAERDRNWGPAGTPSPPAPDFYELVRVLTQTAWNEKQFPKCVAVTGL